MNASEPADVRAATLPGPDGDVEVALPHPPAQSLVAGGVIVVRTESPPRTIDNRNVHAFAADGTPLWRLAELGDPAADDPVVGLALLGSGALRLDTWTGDAWLVDPATGDARPGPRDGRPW